MNIKRFLFLVLVFAPMGILATEADSTALLDIE